MKVKMPVNNKVQIVPKIIHAKKDMWFMETSSKNTIAVFNAKEIGAIVNKYLILISDKYLVKINKNENLIS